MAKVEWDNKKSLFTFVNIKRGCRENIGQILVEDGHLTNMHGEKVEAFNAGLGIPPPPPPAVFSSTRRN